MTAWRSLLLWLSSLAADADAVAEERVRCEAAVMASYASFAVADAAPVPPVPLKPCACGGTRIIKPDGSIPQPCRCGDNCVCKPTPGVK